MLRELARSILFPGCPEPFPAERDLASEVPGARLARLRTADGVSITGALCPSGTANAPVVIQFHGNGESAAQNLWLAPVLAREGFDVFLAEYRGYGGNEGAPSEEGFYADAEAAIAWLAAEGYGKDRVVIAGRSIGTGVAVEMAHRGRGSALVLVSPFTRIVDLARRMVGPLATQFVWDKFETLAKMPDLTLPVAVIHGTEDELIPYEMGVAIAKAARNATLVPVKGGTHNDLPGLPRILARECSAILSRRAPG